MTLFTTKGRLISITDTKTGTSKKGTNWKAVSFLIEIADSEKFVFKTMDNLLISIIESLAVGSLIQIDFSIKANEWQGKYYTELVPIEISTEQVTTLPKPQPLTDLPF